MKIGENNKEIKNLFSEGKPGDSTGGFSVPANYFEKFETDIQEKVSRIPNLYTAKTENPFAVPDRYFSELENSVREKASLAGESASSRPLYVRRRLIPVMASLLVVVACTVVFLNLNRNRSAVSEKDISFSDIYRTSYLIDFDEGELAEMIDDSVLTSNASSYENYLIEYNTDIYTITEEL